MPPTPSPTPTGFRERAVASFERRRFLREHQYRVDLGFRRAVFYWSVVGAALVGGLALLTRSVVTDLDAWAVSGVALTVAAARIGWLRPPLAPHAHGLPGVEDVAECSDRPVDVGRWVLATRWAAGVALVVATFAPGRIVLAVGVAVAGLAWPALRVQLDVRSARRRIAAALGSLDPRWALVYGGLAGGPTHMSMWDPYLRASGDQGAVFNLRARYCHELRTNAGLPLPWVQLGSDTLGDLQVVTVPTIKAFFHVHNAPVHLRLFGIKRVTHVWLGHGDSDKPGSRHPRHVNFDLLVVSGQAAIDRYTTHGVDIPREKFVILGRPQVGDIATAEQPVTAIARPRVLYAPTWVGRRAHLNFSSIKVGPRIVTALIEAGCDVVFRPHPVFLRLNQSHVLDPIHAILQADTEDPSTPGNHVWGDVPNEQWSVFDCMNNSDALLSDVSSVVSDWLQSTKPFAMLSMRHEVEDFATEIPVAAASYVVASDLSNLGGELERMLREDPLAEARRAMKEHVLGPYEGHESAEVFARFVRDVGRGIDPRDDPQATAR